LTFSRTLFLPLLFVLGCGRAPVAQIHSASEALSRVRKQSECSRALSGEARLSFHGDGRRLAGRMLYLMEVPDRIRFDVISPFGATLSTLTSDGERFSLFDLQEKSFFFGPARTCNVMRFTRVPLPPSALVETLRGRPATIVHERSEIRWVSPLFGGGHYEATLYAGPGIRQELRFGVRDEDYDAPVDAQRLRYLGTRVFEGDRLSYEVTLSRYQRVLRKPTVAGEDPLDVPLPPSGPECDAEVPGLVRFRARETGYDLTIDNEEVWHNPPLPSSSFTQEAPGGVRQLESRCSD
jgi:hypothetical protein